LVCCLCFVLAVSSPHNLLTSFNISGIAKRIAAAGYAVYAMDYPGFALSYGLHGYIASFDGMVDHVIEKYARIRGFFNGLSHVDIYIYKSRYAMSFSLCTITLVIINAQA
jgi:hypothetical protein